MKANKPEDAQLVGDVKYDTMLFCDLKTDEEKSTFFLSGRGYETGVIAQAIQNDVAMAYQRCSEYRKELEALRDECERWKRGSEIRDEQNQDLHSFIMDLKAECEELRKDAERYWWLRRGGE